MKSKKGSVMFTFTAIAAGLAMLTFFIVIIGAEKHKLANGEDQLAAIDAFYKGEKLKLFFDEALKFSIQSSAFVLGSEGGYHQANGETSASTSLGCGAYNGVPLWNTNQKECYPQQPEDSYKRLVAEHLNYYMTKYQGNLFFTSQDLVLTRASLSVSNSIPPKDVEIEITREINAGEDDFVAGKWTFWPVDGQVNDCFGGPRSLDGSFHEGVDFQAAEGTKVRVVESGQVYQTCSCVIGDRNCCGGFGNTIVVKHNDNLYTRYSHLSKINYDKDDEIETGEVIGLSGNTGQSEGPHLHFSVYTSSQLKSHGDYSQNPFRFLPREYQNFKSNCPLDSYGEP